jgi:hypothetical protein
MEYEIAQAGPIHETERHLKADDGGIRGVVAAVEIARAAVGTGEVEVTIVTGQILGKNQETLLFQTRRLGGES